MTLYRHFPSREALVEALLLRGATGALRWFSEEVARLSQAAGDGAARQNEPLASGQAPGAPGSPPTAMGALVPWQERALAWATAWARWCCAYPHLVREMCASRELGRRVADRLEPPLIAVLQDGGLDPDQARRGTWLLADVIHAAAMPGEPGTVSERAATALEQVRFLLAALASLAAAPSGAARVPGQGPAGSAAASG